MPLSGGYGNCLWEKYRQKPIFLDVRPLDIYRMAILIFRRLHPRRTGPYPQNAIHRTKPEYCGHQHHNPGGNHQPAISPERDNRIIGFNHHERYGQKCEPKNNPKDTIQSANIFHGSSSSTDTGKTPHNHYIIK
tara:strand:- start:24 stop:425 length:402 start_codon:yes stop_codon:yes gene_type:complete